MKNKLIRVLLCAVLLVALSLTALGIAGLTGKDAETEQQPFKSFIENRMNFTVDNTEFSYLLEQEEETFLLSFNITAAKTEADFYALLNSITLTGAQLESVIYEPGDDNGEFFNPHSLVMPVDEDGKPITLSWRVTATFKCNTANVSDFSPQLQINYTSGLKYSYSDNHILTIPLKVTVVNIFMLTSVIDDAQTYIDSGLYNAESVNSLRSAVNTASALLTDKNKLTNDIIAAQCGYISRAVQNLK